VEHLRNDLFCVKLDVKPQLNQSVRVSSLMECLACPSYACTVRLSTYQQEHSMAAGSKAVYTLCSKKLDPQTNGVNFVKS